MVATLYDLDGTIGLARLARDSGQAAGDLTRGFTPTLFLYDNYPGGVGLSLPLFERREELRRQAVTLIEACPCAAGCPACVGPILASTEALVESSPKATGLAVLRLLGEPA